MHILLLQYAPACFVCMTDDMRARYAQTHGAKATHVSNDRVCMCVCAAALPCAGTGLQVGPLLLRLRGLTTRSSGATSSLPAVGWLVGELRSVGWLFWELLLKCWFGSR